MMLYQAVQIIYWLVLSLWLGGMVFVAVAAPLVFRVVRRLEARSGKYSDPALDDDQTSVVAGEIVGTLLARLGQMQMACAIILLPLMLVQFALINLEGPNFIAALVRFALWLAMILLLFFEWRVHYPRAWLLRQTYLDHASEPEVANPAREAFETEHRRSEQLFLVGVCLVMGMVMLSANITPRTVTTTTPVVSSISSTK